MLKEELRCLVEGWKKQADLMAQARLPVPCVETLVRKQTLHDCIRQVEYPLASRSEGDEDLLRWESEQTYRFEFEKEEE